MADVREYTSWSLSPPPKEGNIHSVLKYLLIKVFVLSLKYTPECTHVIFLPVSCEAESISPSPASPFSIRKMGLMMSFCPKTRWMTRSLLEKCAWSRNIHKLNICFLWSTHFCFKNIRNTPSCKLICWNITWGKTQKRCICCSHDLIIPSKNYSWKCLKSFPTTPAMQTYRRGRVWFFYVISWQ